MPRKPDKQIMCASNFAAMGLLMKEVAHGTQLCAPTMSDEQIDEVTDLMEKAIEKMRDVNHYITALAIGDAGDG